MRDERYVGGSVSTSRRRGRAQHRRRSRAQRRTRREKERQQYAARKQALECTRCGRPAPDDRLCPDCLAYTSTATNGCHAKRYADRRKRKVCVRCEEPSPNRVECLDCLRALGKAPLYALASTPNPALNQNHGTAVAMGAVASPAWVTERDGKRRRFRGQGRRGAPSRLHTDEWDRRVIDREMTLGMATLAVFRSAANKALPKIQREAALREALGHFELAQRALEGLVERTGKGLQ